MKSAPDEKKTEVVATTKVKLTIRGQTFEMTMEELKALHEKIGKVVDVKPTVILAPSENEKHRRERPFYPPYPPPYHFLRQDPWPGERIMCLTSGEGC